MSVERKVLSVWTHIAHLDSTRAGGWVTGRARRSPRQGLRSYTQRPTFTSDTSTSALGTVELELGTAFWQGFFTLPEVMKFTPFVTSGLFHQGEFSIGFDTISCLTTNGQRMIDFGDHIGLVFRRPVYKGKSVSVAVAPQATLLVKGDEGVRVGTTGILWPTHLGRMEPW